MNALQANLKHLYQRPAMWFNYLILAIMFKPIVIEPLTAEKDKSFSAYLIISTILGVMVASLQKEILTKPFSYCLPDHQRTMRKVFFLTGITVNSLLSLIFFKYPGIDMPYSLLVVCGACFMGILFYLFAIWTTILGNNTFLCMGILFPISFGLIFLGIDVDGLVAHIIITFPLFVIAVSVLFCVYVWKYLDKDSLRRRHCDKVMMGFFNKASSKKAQMYLRDQASGKVSEKRVKFNNKVFEFFLRQLERQPYLTRGKYIWGHILVLHESFLNFWNVSFLVIITVITALGGYGNTGKVSMLEMIFLVPLAVSFNFDLLPYRSILLPGGRVEKFYASTASAFALTLLMTAVMIAIGILSIIYSWVLPAVRIKGEVYSYVPMNIEHFLLCLSLIPIGFIFATLLPKNSIIKVIIMTVFFGLYMFLGLYRFLWGFGAVTSIWITLPLILVGWACFLRILSYHCRKRCLIGQS